MIIEFQLEFQWKPHKSCKQEFPMKKSSLREQTSENSKSKFPRKKPAEKKFGSESMLTSDFKTKTKKFKIQMLSMAILKI